jgi:hypothetical protein
VFIQPCAEIARADLVTGGDQALTESWPDGRPGPTRVFTVTHRGVLSEGGARRQQALAAKLRGGT